MSVCPYHFWHSLPSEMRRRLRTVYASRGGAWGDTRAPVNPSRIAHLSDSPRCACVREEVAA